MNFTIKNMTTTALVCAMLCILCPLSVPIGPVPVSLGVLMMFLAGFVLKPLYAVTACALYIILGIAGLPVFAGYRAGIGTVMGPTGGFIVGYLFLVWVTAFAVTLSYRTKAEKTKEPSDTGKGGKLVKRFALQLLGMLIGLAVLYLIGTVWFIVFVEGATLSSALAACVTPFVVIDLLKAAAALIIGNALRAALLRARLL